jgi:hypothetical protein
MTSRFSNKAKVESLLNISESIILEMSCEANYIDNHIFSRFRFIQAIAKNEEFLRDTAFYLVIAIHFYFLSKFTAAGWSIDGGLVINVPTVTEPDGTIVDVYPNVDFMELPVMFHPR